MVRTMRYDGTMLMTDQIDDCRAFYWSLLGVEPEAGAGWAKFPLSDGSYVALHSPWRPGMTTTGGSQVLLLQVDSLVAETTRLAGLGIQGSEPHEIPGGAVITLQDPDGRTIQLIERNG